MALWRDRKHLQDLTDKTKSMGHLEENEDLGY
jgi:hypothetical protein